MKIFLTGATGYIGGSLAIRLVEEGYQVQGLVRSKEKAQLLENEGIYPVLGSLDDEDVLAKAAKDADGVINAASSDHRAAVEALVKALAGSEKPLIHTSGSSIVCDDARGEFQSPKVYNDDSYVVPVPMRESRIAIDRFVRSAGVYQGIRAIVICPPTIYGNGRGLQPDSDQIPKLTKKSKERGVGLYVGKGLNRWSNVYIDDLVDLYLLALEKAPSGSFFFAENGEEAYKTIAESISKRLGFGGKTDSWPADDAIAEYGDWARFALGSNSRVRAVNARRLLGWKPSGPPLLEAVEKGI
jgi:nucleoside-diphosphate-sugar epimerase